MSELGDRRARKKAQTHEQIRRAAQQLFSEHGFDSVTIADVAATADVAVQTVFNHFPTKEELFFDGRTPWVDEPAEVVLARRSGQAPLAALREWTVARITEAAARDADEERRGYLSTMAASPALRSFELCLSQRGERRLAAALVEAWSSDPAGGPHLSDGEVGVRMAADLTAAIWVAGARSLLVELRAVADDDEDATAIRSTVITLAGRLFDRLERGMGALLSLPGAELTDPMLALPGPMPARQSTRRAG